MRFSIIVPVYNVADYLEKCVASVLANDCASCEIILVDDGSTDGRSGQLCDALASAHPELIQVIHQKNRGLGGARNTGLEAASGEYLFFIDSDDYISPESLKLLSDAIDRTPADIYSFPMYTDNGEGRLAKTETSPQYAAPFSLAAQPEFLLSLPAACVRLWRRTLFLEHGIRYPEGVWYEDIRTSTKLFAAANTIVTLPEPLYYYLARPGSITRNTNVARNREILDAFDDILAWFEAKGLYQQYKAALCRLAVDHVLIAASVRVARIDPKSKLLQEFRAYLEQHFPDFQSNPYLSNLPRSKKLAYRLVVSRHYKTLKLLFSLKDKISRFGA